MIMYVSMHITCVNSKDNAKSNYSDHIFVIRENTHLKHRCPFSCQVEGSVVPASAKVMFKGQGHKLSFSVRAHVYQI